jgi:cell division transport system permease protein
MSKNKQNDARAALKQNQQFRRRWLTFVRMCRYGVNNFSRNAWLTVAATAVMTITLLIVFSTLAARNVLTATVDDLRSKVDVSIYLKSGIKSSQVVTLTQKLYSVSNVSKVRYISADEAKQAYARQNSTDPAQLAIISELPNNPFPASLRVSVKDLNKMKQVETFVTTDSDFITLVNPQRKPSFAGERREIITNIGRWVEFADRVGIASSTVFIVMSVLIIFNTIRMAIFNRKEEIQMMKLIGADRNFIRGPFMVEGIMYGFIAAIIATILGWVGLRAFEPQLTSYGIVVQPTLDAIVVYIPIILVGMIALGAFIGVISSLFAVRRYLKV